MLLVQQPDPFQPGADMDQTSTLHTRLSGKLGVACPIFGFSHSAAVVEVIEQAKAMGKLVLALIGSPKHAQQQISPNASRTLPPGCSTLAAPPAKPRACR